MSLFPAGTGMHATAVIFREFGVLIVGESGSGKSALALALLARARQAQVFGALVGDDRIWVEAVEGRLVARGARHMAGLIERRGAGIETVPSEPDAVIALCVRMSGSGGIMPHRPEMPGEAVFAGVSIPCLTLDSTVGAADNALAVEALLERNAGIGLKKQEFRLNKAPQCTKISACDFAGEVHDVSNLEPDD